MAGEGITDRIVSTWWGKSAGGLLSIVGGVYFFSKFSKLESGETESMRVNRIVGLMYDIGGKWTVSSILCVLGVALLGWGIAQLVRGRE